MPLPYEPLIRDYSSPGRSGASLPSLDVPAREPAELLPGVPLRTDLPLPEVAEIDCVRHFTRLSQRTVGNDTVFYPLGSCTMKYNPKVNEEVAGWPGFSGLHPLQPPETCQGALEMLLELEGLLCEIGGMDACTLQPAAGAQGEFTGLMLIRAWQRERGEGRRSRVLVPDSAHGTNPATVARCGYSILKVSTDERGRVDMADLGRQMSEDVVALMMTNPNTLGLFEDRIQEISALVHERGGLMYCDGANMNAILGVARPGDMGFDVMHFNTHKTFSTPHGGGGPGAGPVAVKSLLEPYLPRPRLRHRVVQGASPDGHHSGTRIEWDYECPQSIGRLHPFAGNFGVLLRAYTYLRQHGAPGLLGIAQDAVLNANYLREKVQARYPVPHPGPCMHEFVASANEMKRSRGVRALDVAKRLLDYGSMAPTIYFPLLASVPEAIMIEPTETTSRETLDAFAAALNAIAEEDPHVVLSAPHTTPVRRVDETRAARDLNVQWGSVTEAQ